MECNKDEATRAKELAEKKFMARDIRRARKFALKAQKLYPGLEGIPQLIATLDVYIAAENKINGEADWYGILGVNPQADDEAVRKQYRKLALTLHPDKNKSVGADGAFKFISEAWSLLSDKAKRVAYDQKRSGNVMQKASIPRAGSTASKAANGFYNIGKTTTPSVRTSKNNERAAQSSTPSGRSANPVGRSSNPASSHKPKPNTFWTVCHQCRMQYEYLRVYLNHNLLCPNCHEPFLAVETAPPSTSTPSPWTFSERQNSKSQAANKSNSNSRRNHPPSSNAAGFSSHDSHSQSNFQWGPFSRTGGAPTAAQAASVVRQAYEKVKRQREESQAATKREEAMKRKHHSSKRASGASSTAYSNVAKRRRGMEDGSGSIHGTNITNQMGAGNGGTTNLSGSRLSSLEAGRVNGTTKHNNARDIPQVEIQSLLVEKARGEIRKKQHEWNSLSPAKTASKDFMRNENEDEGQNKSLVIDEAQDHSKSGESVDKICGDDHVKSFAGCRGVNTDAQTFEAMSINVPDSDFHDFDKYRTEKSFEENQIWAAYDDNDGMPRYYAMIRKVISLNPFKLRIRWLYSRNNNELDPLNWVSSGFSKTSGEFRIGRRGISSSLNSFSHQVRWKKGIDGAICIYPRKGDVWAIYRNWSPDWNDLTSSEVIHKYDLVEVLDSYNEELGVTVTPLVKVAGFKAVFHRHLDYREIRRIPRKEMSRFSHQVPSHLLTSQEAPKPLKGCRELDPAATPTELLEVIIDVKEEEILETDKKISEEVVVDVEKANDTVVLENCEKPIGIKVLEEI